MEIPTRQDREELIRETLNELKILNPNMSINELLKFIGNILLIFDGARLAYRMDVFHGENIDRMSSYILEKYPELSIIPVPKEEPLIFLGINREYIIKTISDTAKSDINIGFAKVLGYRYIGKDWMKGDRYAITFKLEFDNVDSSLYSFMVPIKAYNKTVIDEVIDDLLKFQFYLKRYGFSVRLSTLILRGGNAEVVNGLP